jgi:hypothetical protein
MQKQLIEATPEEIKSVSLTLSIIATVAFIVLLCSAGALLYLVYQFKQFIK